LIAVWRAHRTGSAPNLPPETVAACLAVLAELGLDPAAAPEAKVDLERSPTYREALERFALVERHLGAHAVG
jgi:hypothetical protein